MGLIGKSLVAVGLAVGIANYFVYINTGKLPLADLYERWGSGWAGKVSNPTQLLHTTAGALERNTPIIGGSETVTYRWRDSDGGMHFSDKRPSGVDPARVQEMKIPAPALIMESSGNTTPAAESADGMGSPIEKARAAAKALEARSAVESIE